MGIEYDPRALDRGLIWSWRDSLRRGLGRLLPERPAGDGNRFHWLRRGEHRAGVGYLPFGAEAMNRRGFIGSLFASIGAAILPATAWANPLRHAATWKMWEPAPLLSESWYCIVHPDCARDLRDLEVRDKWKDAYRQARINRFCGSPQEILARHKPARYPGEIGTIGGMKIIVQGDL